MILFRFLYLPQITTLRKAVDSYGQNKIMSWHLLISGWLLVVMAFLLQKNIYRKNSMYWDR